jgi:hypothetical protein
VGDREEIEDENEGYTPIDIVENIQEDHENFQGQVDVQFENSQNVSTHQSNPFLRISE